jgi:hypothetical protein
MRVLRPVSAVALGVAALAVASAALAIGTPTLQWQRCGPTFCQTGWYASPAVIDVDRDGVVDVLGGGYTLLSVRGDTGAIQWSHPATIPGRMWPGPAVADLDGDGGLEIVVAQSNQLSILDAAGDPVLAAPLQPFGTSEMRTLAVADLDGDGSREILTARASGGSEGTWTVLDADGGVRTGWPRRAPGDPGYAWGAYNQNLAAGDLDGDGDLEIAASSDVHYLAAFADDGVHLPASAIYGAGEVWSQVGVHYDHAVDLRGYANCDPGVPPLEARPNFADAPPTIGDLDGDGTNEIVVVGSFYDCRTPNYQQLFQVPMVFEIDRTRWVAGPWDWTQPPLPDAFAAPLAIDYEVIESAEANPVLADLDGDGTKEILHASYDGRVHAFWLDRTQHGNWPFDVNLGESELRFASEPAVADLDGDGVAEVVFTTWTEKGSGAGGDLFIVDSLGNQLQRVALPRSAANWDGALAAPTLARLDADANLEVVVNTAHSGLVAYEIPGTANARLLWPTGRGNIRRTAPEPTGAGAGVAAAAALARLTRRRRPRSARASESRPRHGHA